MIYENYTGNSTFGFDADDHAPTLILRCQFCPAEIAYYGELGEWDEALFTFAECEQAICTCGAIYGEDDTLEVVGENAQLGTKPPSDVYDVNADLYIPDALDALWEDGLCPSCCGMGDTPNYRGCGDSAGGYADTCEVCAGTGKDLRGCRECGTGHGVQRCPEVRKELMR